MNRLPLAALVAALGLLPALVFAGPEDDPARSPAPHELAALLLSTTESPHPFWDEAEQAWRDPLSRKVWWADHPGWVLADGQGHYWFDSDWRWRDGSPWRDLTTPTYSPSGGVEQWRWLVAAYFPAYAVDSALAIMWCESNGKPWVTSYAGAIGLLQLMPFHSWRAGYGDLYDPETNVRAAAHLYLEQGWYPWIACL